MCEGSGWTIWNYVFHTIPHHIKFYIIKHYLPFKLHNSVYLSPFLQNIHNIVHLSPLSPHFHFPSPPPPPGPQGAFQTQRLDNRLNKLLLRSQDETVNHIQQFWEILGWRFFTFLFDFIREKQFRRFVRFRWVALKDIYDVVLSVKSHVTRFNYWWNTV